jgi:hypothetical protein
MMPYKALIFDLFLFGTLVERFPVAEYQETLARMAAVLALPSWPVRARRAWRRCFLAFRARRRIHTSSGPKHESGADRGSRAWRNCST